MSRAELHQAKSENTFIVDRNLSVWTLIAVLSCHKVFACAASSNELSAIAMATVVKSGKVEKIRMYLI